MTWPEYVRRLVRGDSQVAIEKKTGIRQSTISRWLRGETRPNAAEAALLAQSYGGNVLEAFVAAGYLTQEEAGMTPPARVEFADVIDADPDLSPEAKEHIKNQYGLLKAASASTRTVQVREQILRSPNLDEETRAELLATLDGGKDAQVVEVTEKLARREARVYPRIVEEAARANSPDDEPEADQPDPDPEGPEHGA